VPLEGQRGVHGGPQPVAAYLVDPGERSTLELVLEQLDAEPDLVCLQPDVGGGAGQEQPDQRTSIDG